MLAPSPAGPLTSQEVVDGYSAGLFLWPMTKKARHWFLPETRTLLPIEGIRISRSLRRTIRRGRYEVRFDTDLAGVLEGCARPEGTWITSDIRRIYTQMWGGGGVHSAEAWDEEGLAGGVYGLALGGVFFAESMFHYRPDAGKVALAALVERCRDDGFALVDTQLTTAHLLTLGAYELPAPEFFTRAGWAFDLAPPGSVPASGVPSFSAIEEFSRRYRCEVFLAR